MPANAKLTCQGRCKSLTSRETSIAALVRCSAWFGLDASKLWHQLPGFEQLQRRQPSLQLSLREDAATVQVTDKIQSFLRLLRRVALMA